MTLPSFPWTSGDVARECGVPLPTASQWAARNGVVMMGGADDRGPAEVYWWSAGDVSAFFYRNRKRGAACAVEVVR